VIDACSAAYERLVSMVREAELPPRERTVEEEDRLALENMVLELEGPEALARYQSRWTIWGLLR
jgi:hypothetical protein